MKPKIEPMLSLAMSMQSNKGVYALLLGSGISRSAGIPKGWGITIDLINQIRAIHPQGKEGDPDPETWYVDTYQTQPDYSDLLHGIAKTPASRSKLLKSYFEPTEEEREEGKKLPTVAHKAIAKLVAKGYIKVIITTNFDRLIEQALEIEGITPQVISNPNKINSAFPIVHHPCTIVKVHGDYIEADTKNTVTELAEYDEALNKYLDRIFDEFGLIISGWSAEWDTALRDAIVRCPNHRFATYWTDRGRRSDEARKLINYRNAELIKVVSADYFFQELEENIYALEQNHKPHSSQITIIRDILNRYLIHDIYFVNIQNLIYRHLDKALKIFDNGRIETLSIKEIEDDIKIFACLIFYLSISKVRLYDELLISSFSSFVRHNIQGYKLSKQKKRIFLYPSIILLTIIITGVLIQKDTFIKNKKARYLLELLNRPEIIYLSLLIKTKDIEQNNKVYDYITNLGIESNHSKKRVQASTTTVQKLIQDYTRSNKKYSFDKEKIFIAGFNSEYILINKLVSFTSPSSDFLFAKGCLTPILLIPSFMIIIMGGGLSIFLLIVLYFLSSLILTFILDKYLSWKYPIINRSYINESFEIIKIDDFE